MPPSPSPPAAPRRSAYQWRLYATNIAGATASSYTRNNVQPADAGPYSVVVTNVAGSVTSSNAVLTVETTRDTAGDRRPAASQTVIAGQSATFTVTATGTAPLSYQWRFNAAADCRAPPTAPTPAPMSRLPMPAPIRSSSPIVAGSTNSADAVLTVNFSLTATATAGGTVSKSPDQASYAPNAVVTLTATANTGYAFTGWSGDATGTDNPLSVTMTANKTITANFGSTTEIVLDNTNAAVSFIGEWQTGSATAGKYGPDYRFASTVAGGLSNAIYRPYIYTPGYYDVSIMYPQGNNRATNAPWSVCPSWRHHQRSASTSG